MRRPPASLEPLGPQLLQDLGFTILFVPVALAPVALMAALLGLDTGDPRERQAIMVGALSSLIAVFLVHRLHHRSRMEARLRLALAAQATTDVLTGLGNRRRLYEEIDRELARAARGGQPVSVLVVDLDGFKQVNDHYGHAKGDQVIVAFARAARRATRTGQDATYRMGGDEFALVLSGAAAEHAALVARRLRTAYREEAAGLGLSEPVDCSVGVACQWPGRRPEPVDAWLGRADSAMYAAKRAGGGVARAEETPD